MAGDKQTLVYRGRERQSVLTALDSDLDLRALLIRATEIGAAFSAHALPDPALASIGAEIETGSFNGCLSSPGHTACARMPNSSNPT